MPVGGERLILLGPGFFDVGSIPLSTNAGRMFITGSGRDVTYITATGSYGLQSTNVGQAIVLRDLSLGGADIGIFADLGSIKIYDSSVQATTTAFSSCDEGLTVINTDVTAPSIADCHGIIKIKAAKLSETTGIGNVTFTSPSSAPISIIDSQLMQSLSPANTVRCVNSFDKNLGPLDGSCN